MKHAERIEIITFKINNLVLHFKKHNTITPNKNKFFIGYGKKTPINVHDAKKRKHQGCALRMLKYFPNQALRQA